VTFDITFMNVSARTQQKATCLCYYICNNDSSGEIIDSPSNLQATFVFFYPANTAMTALAVLESSPVVGSSRNKIDGFVISSMPMFVRFRSPPDTPRMNSVPTYL
jgi:hypothetical protein